MNQPRKQQFLSGWGNYPKAECITYRPEKQSDIPAILQESNSLIARGQGRSYGDASLNKNGMILSERLDKFLNFDKNEGVITVQAGVTLAEILDITIPSGWILPAIPGTKYVSAGGAFACNIHGKNHFKEGDFARHVINISILLASGEELECSASENADIFWATAGGMGLAGIIKRISIKLKPIKSLSLSTQTKKTKNIFEMVECFKASKDNSDYMIGWIDHFATGEKLGRGVFEKAVHIGEDKGGNKLSQHKPSRKGIAVQKFFPSFILNKYSMALYNLKRFASYVNDWKEQIVDFDGFFHPLDNLQNWNRLYGKNGFFQYQFILPETENVADDLQKILTFIQASGQFSFLAVLKYHGDHKGLLSFPIRGYSLALDFPNTPEVHKLQQDLNQKIADMGGRIYLAKDALLTTDLFTQMYKTELPKWRKIIKKLDPNGKFDSNMARRLNMRGDANA